MRDVLRTLKWNRQLPAIVGVDTRDPLFGDNHGGPHVVIITNYDERTGRVTMHNPQGDRVGGPDATERTTQPTVEELFSATFPRN